MQLVAEHGSASADTVEVAGWADVVVVDYHLGERDGLWLAQQIKRRSAAPPVLIYSAFADAQLAVAAIVAGADGLLAKATLAEELSVAIRRLASGRQYFPAIPPSLAAALCARFEPVDQAICSMLIHGVPPANRRAPRSRSGGAGGATRVDPARNRATDDAYARLGRGARTARLRPSPPRAALPRAEMKPAASPRCSSPRWGCVGGDGRRARARSLWRRRTGSRKSRLSSAVTGARRSLSGGSSGWCARWRRSWPAPRGCPPGGSFLPRSSPPACGRRPSRYSAMSPGSRSIGPPSWPETARSWSRA